MEGNKSKIIYVYLNDEKILSSGITVTEFIKYNNKDINKLLLLESDVLGNDGNAKYNFQLIEGKENIYRILSNDNISMGNLSFVDYNDKENIDKLNEEEVMQMLYFSHCRKKLNSLINDRLENNYAYYCHDNDWYIEIFYKNIENYIKTLLNILTDYININIYEIDDIKMLIDIIKNGVIFHISNNEIKIYEVGYLYNIDDIFNKNEELIDNNTPKYNLNVINNKIEILEEG